MLPSKTLKAKRIKSVEKVVGKTSKKRIKKVQRIENVEILSLSLTSSSSWYQFKIYAISSFYDISSINNFHHTRIYYPFKYIKREFWSRIDRESRSKTYQQTELFFFLLLYALVLVYRTSCMITLYTPGVFLFFFSFLRRHLSTAEKFMSSSST